MSDTPRTDAMRGFATSHYGLSKSYDLVCDEGGPFVHADFARQLERELNTERQCAEKEEEDLAALFNVSIETERAWKERAEKAERELVEARKLLASPGIAAMAREQMRRREKP